jgi:putative DNA primase/helicase
MTDVPAEFLDAMRNAGIVPAISFSPVSDGRIHRFRIDGERKGKKSGWYSLRHGEPPHGIAGDWRTGSRLNWIPTGINGHQFDRSAWEARVHRQNAEGESRQAAAAAKARAIWNQLQPAKSDHAYLKNKSVTSGLCRVTSGGKLAVPVYDAVTDELISIQYISPDGDKRFLAGGRIQGGCAHFGFLTGAETIAICEGYATAATIFAACDFDAVVVAFCCGNLGAVGKAMRQRYQKARIVFGADNDEATEGNPGVSKAMEAALAIGSVVAVPRRPGDFNDLAAAFGLEAVRLSFAALFDTAAAAKLDELVGPAREPDEAVFARLARLTEVDYDRARAGEAKRLGIKVSTLDAEVGKRRAKAKTGKAAAPPPKQRTIAELESAASNILTSPNVLDRFVKVIGQRVAGEVANLKRLYLSGTTRLFDKPMHTAIKGLSASGKSEIRHEVLSFMPPEDVISFTTLSEKALLYMPDDFAHKILSMGEAAGVEQQSFQDYLIRELMSDGRLRYPVAQKVGKQIVTVTVEKNGPVAFMVTTTRASLHEENETRLLTLETDDSPEQTRAVLEKIAEVEGGVGGSSIEYGQWHDYQRWLAAGERRVAIPWALSLARLIPVRAVRARRDFGQLLRAVKAHALLHRPRRERNDKGCIVATIAAVDDGEVGAPRLQGDYEAVRELFADILAEASESTLGDKQQQTIKAVDKLQPVLPAKDLSGNILRTEGATTEIVAKELGVDRTTAFRRLRVVERKGLIVNLEPRPNPRPSYWRTVHGSKLDEALGEFLPSAERLQDEFDEYLRRRGKEGK